MADPREMMAGMLAKGGMPTSQEQPQDDLPMDPSEASPYDLLDQLSTMSSDPQIQEQIQVLFQLFNDADQRNSPQDSEAEISM